MGRKAIQIEFITDDRNRETTLRKRSDGLIKKAADFCQCTPSLIAPAMNKCLAASLCAHESAVLVTRPSSGRHPGDICAYWSTTSLDRVAARSGKTTALQESSLPTEMQQLRGRVVGGREQIEKAQVSSPGALPSGSVRSRRGVGGKMGRISESHQGASNSLRWTASEPSPRGSEKPTY